MYFLIFFGMMWLLSFSRAESQLPEIEVTMKPEKTGFPNLITFHFTKEDFEVRYKRVDFLKNPNSTEESKVAEYLETTETGDAWKEGVLKIKNINGEFVYEGTFLKEHLYTFKPELSSNDEETFQSKRMLLQGQVYRVENELLISLHRDAYEQEVEKNEDFQERIIELFVHVDYTIYARFLDVYKGDKKTAEKELKKYYSQVMRSVNANFERIKKPDFGLSTFVHKIHIATEKSIYATEQEGEKIGMNDALAKAEEWLKNNKIPDVDATIFFADFDNQEVKYANNSHTLCNGQTMPIALIQNINQLELAYYTSKTIGYFLGSSLDGRKRFTCNPYNYIMAGKESDSRRRLKMGLEFSGCSIQHFIFYAQILNLYEGSNCLLNKPVGEEDLDADKTLIGHKYDLDQQCQLIFGPESYNCGSENMCVRLLCYNPVEKTCYRFARLTAADGTRCGTGKMCFETECIRDGSGEEPIRNECTNEDFTEEFSAPIPFKNCAALEKKWESYCWDRWSMYTYCCNKCYELRSLAK